MAQQQKTVALLSSGNNVKPAGILEYQLQPPRLTDGHTSGSVAETKQDAAFPL